jgi:sugar phosphate isomerase/epimerase
MNFPVVPVLEEIRALGNLGFDYLELAMDPPQAHHTQIRAQRREIASALKQQGWGLVCHLPTFVHTADLTESIRRASREEIIASLEVAADLGARKVVLHPSTVIGMARHAPDMARRYALESLAAVVTRAERLGVVVCLENLFYRLTPFSGLDDLAECLAHFPSLALTLDVGHAHLQPGGNAHILALLARFGSRMRHMHVSDNFGKHDEHLPIGQGAVDFKALAEVLRHCGYDESITLEVFAEDRRHLQRSRDALAGLLAG